MRRRGGQPCQQGHGAGFVAGDPQGGGLVETRSGSIEAAKPVDGFVGPADQAEGGMVLPEVVAPECDEPGIVSRYKEVFGVVSLHSRLSHARAR